MRARRKGLGAWPEGCCTTVFPTSKSWTEQLRRSSSAVFAALAQNPSLIDPMRAAYGDLHQRIAEDGLPPGVGEAVASAIDGLWLYWVLGLVPVDQGLMNRIRPALEEMLVCSQPARSSPKAKACGRNARQRRPKDARCETEWRTQIMNRRGKYRGWIASAVLLATVVASGLALRRGNTRPFRKRTRLPQVSRSRWSR